MMLRYSVGVGADLRLECGFLRNGVAKWMCGRVLADVCGYVEVDLKIDRYKLGCYGSY